MSPELLVVIHAAATWAMVGLIWFVQLVHYPLFAAVGRDQFVAYELRHTRRTTWVVAMFMPIELVTAVWIALSGPGDVGALLGWVGVGLVAALWAVTIAVQVPQHRRLSAGYDPATAGALVGLNWLRTAFWSGRGLIAASMLVTV